MPVYTAHLREIIKKGISCEEDYENPLKGFKIAVDAGNGGGGFLAKDVLAKLGADTSGNYINIVYQKALIPCSLVTHLSRCTVYPGQAYRLCSFIIFFHTSFPPLTGSLHAIHHPIPPKASPVQWSLS